MSDFGERVRQLIDQARKLVGLELAYRVRPPSEDGTPAAVTLLLGLSREYPETSILLTRRTHTVQSHKGQYAFPGGMMDPEDVEDLGLVTTALRELEEEMGISRELVQPVGDLPKIWTPTGFLITPVVGVLMEPVEAVEIVPSPHEIDHYFWAKIPDLETPGVHSVEMRRHGEVEVPIEVYTLGEHRIWGATGAMLKNFLDRLRKLS